MTQKMISKMTRRELAKEYESVTSMIDVSQCYGVRDLMWRDALEKEIDKRGGRIYTIHKIEWG